ncbi:MAG TPA: DUF4339 domain-containing protein [Rhizomicrobium sp.]|nr:DUF4339 domain-containing protein [Rhizomicrobium sp.]
MMANSWTLSVGGHAYGPYTIEQMREFHAEQRLAPHSLVARPGQDDFRPAHEDPDLQALFQSAAEEAKIPSAEIVQPHRFGARAQPEAAAGSPGRFVIVAEMKSGSTTGLEEEIFSLGSAHAVGPNAWILSSEASINAIRMALVQKLGKFDALFIVDAAHDKAAWFNFGPETESRIRKMWTRPDHPPEKTATKRA